jgi:hypothetical protein
LLLALASCLYGCPADAPIPIVPTRDNPCGRGNFLCEDGNCCPEGYTCGGGQHSVGVPAGMCEFVEQNDYSVRKSDAGIRSVPQWSPK